MTGNSDLTRLGKGCRRYSRNATDAKALSCVAHCIAVFFLWVCRWAAGLPPLNGGPCVSCTGETQRFPSKSVAVSSELLAGDCRKLVDSLATAKLSAGSGDKSDSGESIAPARHSQSRYGQTR